MSVCVVEAQSQGAGRGIQQDSFLEAGRVGDAGATPSGVRTETLPGSTLRLAIT